MGLKPQLLRNGVFVAHVYGDQKVESVKQFPSRSRAKNYVRLSKLTCCTWKFSVPEGMTVERVL